MHLFTFVCVVHCPDSFSLALLMIGCGISFAQRSFIAHYLVYHMYSRVYKLCFKCVYVGERVCVILLLLLYHYLI